MAEKICHGRKYKNRFKTEWELQFLVTENKREKVECIICNVVFNSPKFFNINRHYKRLHQSTYEMYSRDRKMSIIDEFKVKIQQDNLLSESTSMTNNDNDFVS